MGVLALLAVDELHQQWPLDVELGDLVEGRGRQDDLGSEVEIRTLVSRGHDYGIASVVLVEALDDRAPAVPGHVEEVVRIGRVEPASEAC